MVTAGAGTARGDSAPELPCLNTHRPPRLRFEEGASLRRAAPPGRIGRGVSPSLSCPVVLQRETPLWTGGRATDKGGPQSARSAELRKVRRTFGLPTRGCSQRGVPSFAKCGRLWLDQFDRPRSARPVWAASVRRGSRERIQWTAPAKAGRCARRTTRTPGAPHAPSSRLKHHEDCPPKCLEGLSHDRALAGRTRHAAPLPGANFWVARLVGLALSARTSRRGPGRRTRWRSSRPRPRCTSETSGDQRGPP